MKLSEPIEKFLNRYIKLWIRFKRSKKYRETFELKLGKL